MVSAGDLFPSENTTICDHVRALMGITGKIVGVRYRRAPVDVAL